MGRACKGSISAAAVALTAGWTLGVVPFSSQRLKVPIPITYGSTGCSCFTDGCVQIIVHSTVRGLSNARARPMCSRRVRRTTRQLAPTTASN